LTYASTNHLPAQDFATVAAYLGPEPLAKAIARRDSSDVKRLLLILGACASGVRHLSQLAATTRIPVKILETILQNMRDWDLLDERQRLTNRGRAELARQTRLPRHSTISLKTEDEPYYPRQLRGVGDV